MRITVVNGGYMSFALFRSSKPHCMDAGSEGFRQWLGRTNREDAPEPRLPASGGQ